MTDENKPKLPMKLIVMVPLMFAMRKLDGDDPDIIFKLRCAYGSVQAFILIAVLYLYLVAWNISKSKCANTKIYVGQAAQPFNPEPDKVKYTECYLGPYALSTALKLAGSTVFGIIMTCGLHWYKGMIIGLGMQSVMGPFNLLENAFAKAILMGGGTPADDGDEKTLRKRRIFGEKYRDEVSDKDEIVDGAGEPVKLGKQKPLKIEKEGKGSVSSFETLLLDTWDEGTEADIAPLMKALKKDNINFKTSANGWTPLMIMAAIGAKGSSDAIKKMKALGAKPTVTDKEGWNALHWAAFHGSLDGAKSIMTVFDGMRLELYLVKDLEGKTALDHAEGEKNDDIASYLKTKIDSTILKDTDAEQEGIRKRKQ